MPGHWGHHALLLFRFPIYTYTVRDLAWMWLADIWATPLIHCQFDRSRKESLLKRCKGCGRRSSWRHLEGHRHRVGSNSDSDHFWIASEGGDRLNRKEGFALSALIFISLVGTVFAEGISPNTPTSGPTLQTTSVDIE